MFSNDFIEILQNLFLRAIFSYIFIKLNNLSMLKNIIKFAFGKAKLVHTSVCIVGGGTCGVSIAAKLIRSKKFEKTDVRVFEP